MKEKLFIKTKINFKFKSFEFKFTVLVFSPIDKLIKLIHSI